MAVPIYYDPEKRHDFVLLFDVTDGNPNGDPDAGNLPRVDPETMHGLVTDVSIKRKIRDWVDVMYGNKERYKIYVQNKGIALNTLHERAYTALNLNSTGSKQKAEDVGQVRGWMCENFFDIRTFGAVMNTTINCGQVRGPVQLTFARSIDPIVPLDLAITRVAITKVGEDKTTEIGRKAVVPYALYKGYGFVTPHFARQTGFSAEDLETFWTALQRAWELDRSASRGMVAFRGLYIFSHDNSLGNAPAHRLLERIKVEATKNVKAPRQENVKIEEAEGKLDEMQKNVKAPRHIKDYSVIVDDSAMPEGVTLTRIEG